MTPRKIFIAGATGAVGTVTVGLAREWGLEVVPQVRPRSERKLQHPSRVAMELDDPRLPEALRGCTTVLQLVGTMRKRFATGDTYEASDIGTTRHLVAAAKAAGTVDHVVLLSSVGAGRPLGAYLRAKAEAERLVREGGLPFTLVRPSAFEDREGQRMPGVRAAMEWLHLDTWRPITLRELASALLHVASTRAPLGAVLEGRSLWDVVEAARR